MDSKIFPPNVAQRCWRYSRILLLALGFFVFGSQDANASHFAGADLTYECVGNNRYVVTLTLYRDCVGAGMATTEFIDITSASCGVASFNAGLPRDTFYEASQLCASALDSSACKPGGIYPGLEAHIYRDTITLPQTCTDWVVSWSSCCRNAAVTNLAVNQGSFYIEAGINSTVCNSSPRFTSNPVPYFCAGQCYNYNPGAFDPENDSLRYAMTCPLQAANSCIAHAFPQTASQPLITSPANSFVLDSVTGQMSFCLAPGTAQIAVSAVTIFQIVNGDTLGYVQRDIQMVVLNNTNCTSPVGSNDPLVLNGGSFDTIANTFVVCAGETLIFQLILTDPDGDTIRINPANTNINTVFPGAALILNTNPPFRHDSAQLSVQVQAVPANIGVNQFTIGVTDGACPIPGDQILGYNLIIPGVEVTASDTTICPGIAQQIQMNANSFSTVGALAAGSFSWLQLSGPTITFSDDTIPNPIVDVPSTTLDGQVISLQVTFTTTPDPVTGTVCTTTDSVSIFLSALPLNLNIFATETSLCPNNQLDTISFNTAISGPGIDLVNGVYTWTANPSSYLGDLTSTTINNPDAIVSGGANDSVTYAINYTYGLCIGSDSVVLKWRDAIPLVSVALDTICPGDTTQLMAMLSDSVVVIDPTACSTYTVAPITYAPVAGSGTSVSLTDDAITGTLPIGFAFEFFCNTYTQFIISSNGFISFDLASPNGCCSGQLLPNNGFGANNLIALAWEDLNPSQGGTIEYFTVGTAPNRQLIVNYTNVPRFGNASNVSGQIVLHEGTNLIDIHSTSITGAAFDVTTQGIENSDGTAGFAVAGRNGVANWSATNDAFRFTPGVAFLFGPITYNWTPGFSVSDATAYNPNAFPPATTTYVVEINEKGCVLTDSIEIFVNSQIPIPVVTCGTPANQATTVLFEWGGSTGATGWEYSLDSGLTWIPRALADSSYLVTGLTNGDCANILVRATGGAGPCPTNAATYLECCTTPCPMPNTSAITNLSCNGANDGTMTIDIDGGVLGDHPSYTATLFDTSGTQIGAPFVTPVGTSPATATFTGLTAGVYYAYLADTFGCFTNSDTLVITQPDSLIISLDTTTLTTCFADADGTGTVVPAGGTPGYSYQWDAAANGQTTATATGLARGNYDVTLTDANGCEDVLTVTINSPFPGTPAITLNSTPSTSCIGDGSATVFTTFNMVGNANNYTYSWSNNTSTGPSATNLPSGMTTVTVTDLNGCQAIDSVLITGSPTVSVTAMPVINTGCGTSTGQITAVVTGDPAGYTYQWSANAGGQTTALVTGLPFGPYTVTVTGISNGCTAIGTADVMENGALNIVGFNITNPTCGGSDGDATVLTTGAVGTLSYNWSDAQTTNPATGLVAGVYSVTVVDATTGCSAFNDTTLVQPTLAASITGINNPSCSIPNGSLTVTPVVTGGLAGPFTYAWSTVPVQTTATATGLSAGTVYTCDVTYQGCTVTVTSVPMNSSTLQIQITDKDDIICNGDLSSYANVDLITGDSATTTYLWSNGATTQDISGLAAGTYTLTATSGSCTVTQSITVVDISLGVNAWVVASGQKVATIQVNDIVAINAGATTNHANPVYTWSESNLPLVDITDSTAIATDITANPANGTTWLTFTATAGPCIAVDSVMVTVESYMGMPTAFTPNGDGINDLFQPAGLQMSDKVIQFKIYNRWGQLVYDDNVNHFWDGTYLGVPQPQDIYVYVFEYIPSVGNPIIIRGEFTLIR